MTNPWLNTFSYQATPRFQPTYNKPPPLIPVLSSTSHDPPHVIPPNSLTPSLPHYSLLYHDSRNPLAKTALLYTFTERHPKRQLLAHRPRTMLHQRLDAHVLQPPH